MATSGTGNPCIKLCRFDEAGLCRGCYRSRMEVRQWKRLGDDARASILARVEPLIGTGKAPVKRRRKLERKIRKLEKKLAKLRLEQAALTQRPPPR